MKFLWTRSFPQKNWRKKFVFFASENDDDATEETSDGADAENGDTTGEERVDDVKDETQAKIDALLAEQEALGQKIYKLKESLDPNRKKPTGAGDTTDEHNENREHGDLDEAPETKPYDDGGRIDSANEALKTGREQESQAQAKLDAVSGKIEDDQDRGDLKRSGELNINGFAKRQDELINVKKHGELASKDALEIVNKFQQGTRDFQEQFKRLGSSDAIVDKREHKPRLVADFVGHLKSFKGSFSQDIAREKQVLRKYLTENVTDKTYVENYFTEIESVQRSVEESINNFLGQANKRDFDFAGTESFWQSLNQNVGKFKNYLDFDNGVINEHLAQNIEDLALQNKGLNFLDESDFWASEKGFKQRINHMQKNFVKQSKRYEERFGKLRKKVSRDIDRLDDDAFKARYEIDKSAAFKMLADHDAQFEQFSNLRSELSDPKYIDKWIRQYDRDDVSRAEALTEIGNWEDYTKGIEELASSPLVLHGIEKQKKPPKVTHVSVHDVIQFFRVYFEKRERLWKRRSEKSVTQLGIKAFGKEHSMGKEFTKEAESQEADRVGEFETQKGSMNGWDIQRDLYETNDPDEAKCCLNLLRKKGFLKWDDPKLWKTLNRLEGYRRFTDSDINLNSDAILNKVRGACSNIWTIGDFNEWHNSLKSDAVSAQDGFETEFDDYETMGGEVRTDILAEMLKKRHRGETDGVDPARFEAFLRVGLKKGKMNGGPMHDQRLWFLLHGVATGLLGRDVFSRLNDEFLSRYPIVDFFADKSSWKKDGKIVPEGTEGAYKGAWHYQDYLSWAELLGNNNGSYLPGGNEGHSSVSDKQAQQNREHFYFDVVQRSLDARTRVRKKVMESKDWDHEDSPLFVGFLGVQDVGTMLSRESAGQEKNTPSWWQNYLYGHEAYFRSVVRQVEYGDREYAGVSGWSKERIRILKQAGETLQSALAITQTLMGNVDIAGTGRTVQFGKDRWKEDATLGGNAEKAKEKINELAGMFFDNSNLEDVKRDNYKELLLHDSVDKNQKTKEQKLKDGTDTDGLVKELVQSKIGNKIFTEDTDQIYQNLRKYFKMGAAASSTN